MEKIKKNKWWLLAGFLAYSGAVSYLAHQKGKNDCEKAQQTEIEVDQKTLENHEAKLDTIKTESRDAAVKRFHNDNGSK